MLRMLGFDTLYDNHFQDDAIVAMAGREGRIVLTRGRSHSACTATPLRPVNKASVLDRLSTQGAGILRALRHLQCLRVGILGRFALAQLVPDKLMPNEQTEATE